MIDDRPRITGGILARHADQACAELDEPVVGDRELPQELTSNARPTRHRLARP
jgi:hypothetical protein